MTTNKSMNNRLKKVEEKIITTKELVVCTDKDLPKELEDNKHYVHVVNRGNTRHFDVVTENNLSTIKFVPPTREEIEGEIKRMGFDPEYLRLDEYTDDCFSTFRRELRQAQARGEFFRYPGGKYRAEFVFEIPKNPDNNTFYIVVEKEERQNE